MLARLIGSQKRKPPRKYASQEVTDALRNFIGFRGRALNLPRLWTDSFPYFDGQLGANLPLGREMLQGVTREHDPGSVMALLDLLQDHGMEGGYDPNGIMNVEEPFDSPWDTFHQGLKVLGQAIHNEIQGNPWEGYGLPRMISQMYNPQSISRVRPELARRFQGQRGPADFQQWLDLLMHDSGRLLNDPRQAVRLGLTPHDAGIHFATLGDSANDLRYRGDPHSALDIYDTLHELYSRLPRPGQGQGAGQGEARRIFGDHLNRARRAISYPITPVIEDDLFHEGEAPF